MIQNAHFIGILLGWLSKVTIKNHWSGGCWGRFLLRLSLSNIILRRGGVSRPSPAPSWTDLTLVLHKTRVRTRVWCDTGDIPLVPDTALCALLSLRPQCPLCPVTWSHTDRYVPLITNQNFEIFQRKSLLGVIVTLWHVTLWSQLCFQHQPGVRAPGIWRGPSSSIPTSQALQCRYSFTFTLYSKMLQRWS